MAAMDLRIVDKNVELAAGEFRYGGFAGGDAGRGGHVEGKC